MAKFIQVHNKGNKFPRLVNLDWVEEIATYPECKIYFAFHLPDALDQDYIAPDETYPEIMRMILGETTPAHWIPSSDGDGMICSECGTDYCTLVCNAYKINYCPNCGKGIERNGNDGRVHRP